MRRKPRSIDRRDFIKGAALTGGAVLAASLAACADGAEPAGPWMPTWDETTDVVVIGFGGAGATAAMAATDAGAKVIVFEKSPIPDGGSTGCSSGSIHTAPFADPDEWIAKIIEGCYGTTDEDTIRKMVAHAQDTPDLLDKFGMHLTWSDTSSTAPQRPSYSKNGRVDGYEGNEGRFLWEDTLSAVEAMGIDFRLGTPVTELVQDPISKGILGVKVEPPEGEAKYVKALRGVVMALGGYGNSPTKQMNYNQPGVRLWPWGTIYNTGDGFDMCGAVGADLWHLHGLEWSSVNFLAPTKECGASVSTDATTGITPYNHIFVNKAGMRFMNEAKSMNHDIESKPVIDFRQSESHFPNLPFFMVFDSEMFEAKPLYIGSGRANIVNTYAGVQKLIDWGPDNTKALEKGWIFKGDTLEELAANIRGTDATGKEVSVDPAGLSVTVGKYNGYVASQNDPEFGRRADLMAPIAKPPFYAIEMGLSNINTQGGARRNGDCQVVRPDGTPIPRLFSAGEFGSINGYVYVFGNLFEAYTTGHVAGYGAAAMEPWDASDAAS